MSTKGKEKEVDNVPTVVIDDDEEATNFFVKKKKRRVIASCTFLSSTTAPSSCTHSTNKNHRFASTLTITGPYP